MAVITYLKSKEKKIWKQPNTENQRNWILFICLLPAGHVTLDRLLNSSGLYRIELIALKWKSEILVQDFIWSLHYRSLRVSPYLFLFLSLLWKEKERGRERERKEKRRKKGGIRLGPFALGIPEPGGEGETMSPHSDFEISLSFCFCRSEGEQCSELSSKLLRKSVSIHTEPRCYQSRTFHLN